MKSISILLVALTGFGNAAANDSIPESSWSTSAELGAISTSGNTVGTSVTGRLEARQEFNEWSNQYIVTGFFKDDEIALPDGAQIRKRSAERIGVSVKSAYKLLDDGEHLFVLGSHVEDSFGAYTAYSSMAVGHSTQLFQSQGNRVDIEVGPGYFSGTRATGELESGLTVRGAAALTWQMSPSAVFTQSASVERGTSNIHSSAETALRTKINDTMQMKAAFIARNDTDVPVGKKNTDTQTSVTLVYSF